MHMFRQARNGEVLYHPAELRQDMGRPACAEPRAAGAAGECIKGGGVAEIWAPSAGADAGSLRCVYIVSLGTRWSLPPPASPLRFNTSSFLLDNPRWPFWAAGRFAVDGSFWDDVRVRCRRIKH